MGQTRARVLAMVSFVMAVSLFATGCGGGGGGGESAGGGSPPPPPPPPSGSTPTWTAGVFQPASQFKNRCQIVRTGVDIEGNPFPDTAGSTLLENFWLRSWTNETYLWNTEVLDRNPATFNNRLSYFAVLRTTQTTSSGREKDQFHFSQPTAEYLEQINSTPRATFGASYIAFATTPPRDFRIRYTEPNSPAAQTNMGQTNFPRGARILQVDGVDLVNANTQGAVDTLNNGLFPATAGETHTFVVQDAGASTTRTVTMTSVNLASTAVNRTRVISTPSGDVGYVLLNTFSTFSSEQQIAAAFSQMEAEGVSDLVLDLRYNGGGLLAVASQLSYMVAGSARTTGRTFERLQFNAAAGANNPVTGQANQPTPFYSTGVGFSLAAGTQLDTLNLDRVFVLTTGATCSASEAVINGLRGIDVEVILIGGGTCGKPFGFYATDNCGETYFTIQFQGVNDKGFGDYADGFVPINSAASFGVRAPGCALQDDLSRELGDPNEGMLSAALGYRNGGSCPITTARQMSSLDEVSESDGVRTTDLTPLQVFLQNNRDMRMPR